MDGQGRTGSGAVITRWSTAGLVLAAVAALGLADRVPALAAATYLPLPLLSAGLLLRLFIRRSFGLPFVLTAAIGAFGALEMWGYATPPAAEGPELIVVQQNVWWGGGSARSPERWARIEEELLAKTPDVLVLAELPEASWLEPSQRRWQARRPAVHLTWAQGEPEDPNWHRVGIASPFVHTSTRAFTIEDGFVLDVTVLTPRRPVRVWAIDGLSDPARDRRRMLGDLARRLKGAEPPVDILAGDFNAPSKSVGFDALREAYFLASEHSGQWRATWPSGCPLVDVDHVWLRRRAFGLASSRLFGLENLDHRGQSVRARFRRVSSARPTRPLAPRCGGGAAPEGARSRSAGRNPG